MRIALFTDTFLPQVNGVSRTLGRLVDYAASRGHDVAVVSPRVPPGAMSSPATLHIELPGIAVPFYPELRLSLPLDPWSARRLGDFAPDLVHVATEFTVGWSGIVWAERQRLPLVTSFHTDYPSYLAGYGFGYLERHAWEYLRAMHDRARLTFCPSRSTFEQLRSMGFHDRLRIWSRGVDSEFFAPSKRSDAVRDALAPGAELVLLYVGRLAPEKRVDLLLDAFARVRAALPTVKVSLVVVGDGPAAPALRAAAPPDVRFTGYLSGNDLAGAYAAADLFVFPSDTETFGNVVLEAMASGLPVVAAARGGVCDTVQPEKTGLLFPPGDASAFAAAILRLVHDPDLRRGMAEAAREAAVARGWSAIFEDLFGDYRGIVRERRAAVAA